MVSAKYQYKSTIDIHMSPSLLNLCVHFFICLFRLRYKLHSVPGTAIRCCGGRGAQWGFPWIKHRNKSTPRNSQCPTGLYPAPSSSPSSSPQHSPYSDLLSPWTPFACFWGFFRWNPTGGYLLCLHLWLMVLCLWGPSKLLHVSVAPFLLLRGSHWLSTPERVVFFHSPVDVGGFWFFGSVTHEYSCPCLWVDMAIPSFG